MSATSLANLTQSMRMATFRLARRMRTERAVDSMSDGQLAVLAALTTHGPHTLGELAERERISAPAMNRTVNCLQESGYVRRSADDNDGRKVVISMTDAGADVVEETIRRRDAWLDGAMATLTDQERSTLARAAEIMQRMSAL